MDVHGYANCDKHHNSYVDADACCHQHANGDSDQYTQGHRDRDCYTDVYTYTDAYTYGDAYTHGDT